MPLWSQETTVKECWVLFSNPNVPLHCTHSGQLFLLAPATCLEFVPGDHLYLLLKPSLWKAASGYCSLSDPAQMLVQNPLFWLWGLWIDPWHFVGQDIDLSWVPVTWGKYNVGFFPALDLIDRSGLNEPLSCGEAGVRGLSSLQGRPTSQIHILGKQGSFQGGKKRLFEVERKWGSVGSPGWIFWR